MRSFFTFVGTHPDMIAKAFLEHIRICAAALLLGVLVALPAGILLSRNKKAASIVLNIFGVINTIPSLVLLGVTMMVLGLGFMPAVAVLFIYSLLPIMRNTCTGLTEVDAKYIKAARGMGMSRRQILCRVQLPLAFPMIVAGIRISAIYIVSWATLSAFIGAGGLGDLIWSGLQSYNYDMVIAGALPASVLALTISFVLTYAEKAAVRHVHHANGGAL